MVQLKTEHSRLGHRDFMNDKVAESPYSSPSPSKNRPLELKKFSDITPNNKDDVVNFQNLKREKNTQLVQLLQKGMNNSNLDMSDDLRNSQNSSILKQFDMLQNKKMLKLYEKNVINKPDYKNNEPVI